MKTTRRKPTKIVGGREAFIECRAEAYKGSGNAIVYNARRGVWYNDHPSNYPNLSSFGDIQQYGFEFVIACNYNANTGDPFVKVSQYAKYREAILEGINAPVSDIAEIEDVIEVASYNEALRDALRKGNPKAYQLAEQESADMRAHDPEQYVGKSLVWIYWTVFALCKEMRRENELSNGHDEKLREEGSI